MSAYRVLPDDVAAARHDLGQALVVVTFVMIAVPSIMDFEVDFLSFWPAVFFAAIPAAFIPYVSWRKMWVFRSVLEVSCCSFVLVVPVLVLTYGSMRFNMPMADATLINLDRTLGFDWMRFVLAVDRSAFASRLLESAYSSLMKQMVLIPVLLCILNFQARAYQLMTALVVLSLLSAIVSIPFPSVGAYAGHGFDGKSLQNINAYFGYFFLESFNAVRAQDHFVLSLSNSAGIITFPSGHAAFATLSIWAAWPSRWLRYPVLALNMLMILSAITHGAHYLVDVIAGGAVAIMAIRIATRGFPRIPDIAKFLQLPSVFGGREAAPPVQVNPQGQL
ncbi:phosphatase PAP2 family protein [Sphingomonas sp. HDW15A]|uniref:phosphatase PAP2 family protein n=1 Tax=Sphingomonas sp. HDW15A TaxID=2714942 RepID=UPI00140957AB|nr:phosphatase PAP2 family protein [Sphingomonas sp. HDW15A]QIK96673.1 phosphatase PAP2 family protein [Sphingomonas sp. HDW15A]